MQMLAELCLEYHTNEAYVAGTIFATIRSHSIIGEACKSTELGKLIR